MRRLPANPDVLGPCTTALCLASPPGLVARPAMVHISEEMSVPSCQLPPHALPPACFESVQGRPRGPLQRRQEMRGEPLGFWPAIEDDGDPRASCSRVGSASAQLQLPARVDAIRCDEMRYDTTRWDTMRWDTMRCDAMRYDAMRCPACAAVGARGPGPSSRSAARSRSGSPATTCT